MCGVLYFFFFYILLLVTDLVFCYAISMLPLFTVIFFLSILMLSPCYIIYLFPLRFHPPPYTPFVCFLLLHFFLKTIAAHAISLYGLSQQDGFIFEIFISDSPPPFFCVCFFYQMLFSYVSQKSTPSSF